MILLNDVFLFDIKQNAVAAAAAAPYPGQYAGYEAYPYSSAAAAAAAGMYLILCKS